MSPMSLKIREHLPPGDMEFVLGTLGGSESEKDALLSLLSDPQESVAILDHERLLQTVLETTDQLPITPRLYFYLLVRRALRNAGLPDPDLADYVASVLAEFSSIARRTGPVPEVLYSIDLLEQIRRASPYERFFIYSSAGNRYLFLTGIFPAFLERRERRWGAPGVRYYEQVATHAFEAAREHPLAREFALESVYGILSKRFKEMRRVLNGFSDSMVTLN